MKRIFLSLLAAHAAFTFCLAGAFAGQEALRGAQKLDDQLLLALRQSRAHGSFDTATTQEPDIPVKDGDSVLVDMEAAVSTGLVDHITQIGGKMALSPEPTHIIRAMVPLAQLENLAARADIKFISTARPTITSRIEP